MNILKKAASQLQICLLIGILLSFVPTFTSFAQSETDIDRTISSGKMKARAKHALETGDLYTALFYYEVIVSRDSTDLQDRFQLADLYRLARNYSKAEQSYRYVADKDNKDFPLALYYQGQMQKMCGKYVEAKKTFIEFKKESGGIGDKNFKAVLAKEIAGCDSGIVFKDFPENANIQNAGKEINQPHTEFSPYLLNDSTLLFGSLRMETLQYYDNKEENKEKKPVRQIYQADKSGDTWDESGLYEVINDPHMDMGNLAYSPYSNRYFFTKCNSNHKGKVTCNIYVTENVNGKWSHPVMLPDPINMSGYSSTQPTIVIDTLATLPATTVAPADTVKEKHHNKGKAKAKKAPANKTVNRTEYLYFVSDRPGGRGGLDIWYTAYNSANKTWGKPGNLSWVNTSETECTPFFHVPSQTLYFSSNGQATAGGLDIFKMTKDGSRFSKPKNLSFPVNSPQDDLGYNLSANGKKGFFVSNRPGGTPYFHETCCDDIFAVELLDPKPFNCTVEIAVIAPDSVPCKGKLLKISSTDLKTNLSKTDTIRLADCKVKYPLEKNHLYAFSIDVPGFDKDTLVVATRDMAATDVINKELTLKPKSTQPEKQQYVIVNETPSEEKPFVLKDIQYETNQTDLNPDAIVVLDSVLVPFLKAHPKHKIIISSHTDDRGSHSYNMTLSQKRAHNVLLHLLSQGIESSRLVAKGYGETQPIAPNRTPDGGDNVIGQGINRRTEFMLVKIPPKK